MLKLGVSLTVFVFFLWNTPLVLYVFLLTDYHLIVRLPTSGAFRLDLQAWGHYIEQPSI